VHFPSKEHILAELTRVGHEAHQKALRTALLDAGTDPVEKVRALVRAHVKLHATYPHLAVVINEELYTLPPELAAPSLALRQQSAALLIEVIERGLALGHFSCRNLAVSAAAISALGLRAPYWQDLSNGLDVDTLADIATELALRMLGHL
jgi:AcrR family transcriptional regulator